MNPDEKGRAMIGQMFDDAGWKVVSLSRDEVVFSPLLLPIKSIKPLGHYAFFYRSFTLTSPGVLPI